MLIKKMKFSVLLIAIASIYLFLTACDSEDQKEQNAKWETQASKNAQAYINQKYGFSAEITDAKVDRAQGMFGSTPLSDVLVQMQYEERNFTVLITGKEESTDGCDTYQVPEIKQALFETINGKIDGLQVLDIYPKFKSERKMEEPLYGAYFDGSNLAELLEDGVNSFEAFYVQTDFSDEKDFEWLNDYGISAKFVSCREDEILKGNEQTRNITAPHPIYCDNSRTLSYLHDEPKMQTTYLAYELHKYGDFYYYVNNQYNYDKGELSKELPYFTEVKQLNSSLFNGYGAMDASVISKSYSVYADSPMYVHVYYPRSKLDTDKDLQKYWDDFDYGSITEDKDGTVKYAARPITIVGDYVYECLEVQEDNLTTFVFLFDQ